MGLLGSEPTEAPEAQHRPTSALAMRRAQPCCVCGRPMPSGHQYLCTLCGEEGAAIAAKKHHDEQRERARMGVPVHGGASYTDPQGSRTEFTWRQPKP